MKLLKLVLSSIIVSCLASCGDSGGGSSPSDTTAAVTAEASAPESLSSGTSIAFNPEITLQGELSVGNPTQASYLNESLTSDFPSGAGTITVSLAKNSNQLELTFTHGGKRSN